MTLVTCGWVIEHGVEVQRNGTVVLLDIPRRAAVHMIVDELVC